MLGIYGYYDNKNDEIVYIGKDSHIDKKARHSSHKHHSTYNAQQINRIIQNNPKRYLYQELVRNVETEEQLNALEIQYIRQLKPRFNFTDGGEGSTGFKHSINSKKKMSKAKKDIPFGIDTKIRMSKGRSTTGYFRVSKINDKSCKQGFRWKYSYYDGEKLNQITRTDLIELKREVLKRGLTWKEH